MHHKSKQRQKAWDDGVVPSVYYEFALVPQGTIGPGIAIFAISIRCVCTYYLMNLRVESHCFFCIN